MRTHPNETRLSSLVAAFAFTVFALNSAASAGDNLVGGRIELWGEPYPMVVPIPEGRFIRAVAFENAGIAERPDHTLLCWGKLWDEPFVAPSGVFTDFVIGDRGVAIRPDQTLMVWGFGNPSSGRGVYPAGTFLKVASGANHFVGLRTSGAAACWGYNAFGQCNAPAEQFVDVAAAQGVSLGLRADGVVVKWGINLNQWSDQPPTLIERFAQSSPGSPGMIAGWDLQGGWRVWFADGKLCGPCIGGGGKAEEQLPATQIALSEISLSGCGGIGLSPDGLLISWGTSCRTNLRSEISGRRFQSIATASSYAVGVRFPCPADLDSNDSVDAGDISIALLEFGACDSCDADLDQSGEVDAGDISLMLLDFGRCP